MCVERGAGERRRPRAELAAGVRAPQAAEAGRPRGRAGLQRGAKLRVLGGAAETGRCGARGRGGGGRGCGCERGGEGASAAGARREVPLGGCSGSGAAGVVAAGPHVLRAWFADTPRSALYIFLIKFPKPCSGQVSPEVRVETPVTSRVCTSEWGVRDGLSPRLRPRRYRPPGPSAGALAVRASWAGLGAVEAGVGFGSEAAGGGFPGGAAPRPSWVVCTRQSSAPGQPQPFSEFWACKSNSSESPLVNLKYNVYQSGS